MNLLSGVLIKSWMIIESRPSWLNIPPGSVAANWKRDPEENALNLNFQRNSQEDVVCVLKMTPSK